jgi:hypothetical protein
MRTPSPAPDQRPVGLMADLDDIEATPAEIDLDPLYGPPPEADLDAWLYATSELLEGG